MEYTVQEGDCLSSLARTYGLDSYHRIYDHPNNAELKRQRPNPNLLYPGDVVFIPDIDVENFPRVTDQLHKFRLVQIKVRLRVKLLDKQRRPYKYKRYQLDVNHKMYSGYSDAKGLVQESIPADAVEGTLQLWLSDATAEHATTRMPLRIGYLDPLDEVTGVQARLNHLGFDCGAVDGIVGSKTALALEAFQKSVDLPQTGDIDRATSKKLQQMHDVE